MICVPCAEKRHQDCTGCPCQHRVLVDLFGGEGGAAEGYFRAGWEVWSVELDPNRAKYNRHSWYVGDWRDGLELAMSTGRVEAVHASPVCTGYTRGNAPRRQAGHDPRHPADIAPVREALLDIGLPYVIENVEDAARNGFMRADLTLCGSHFGLIAWDTDGRPLRLERHRAFESNVILGEPWRPHEHDRSIQVAGVYGAAQRTIAGAKARSGGYVPPSATVQSDLLGGVPWMTGEGRRLCIPPVYSQHIGTQLLANSHTLTEQLSLL